MNKTAINLKHIDDTSLTIKRRKYGRGYQFIDEEEQLIRDKKLLNRLRSLIIPPMWDQVQICKWDDGHIQAIGRDLKGRKQYIYHSEWERVRQEEKFNKIIDFGTRLPFIRKSTSQDLKLKSWVKPKIMALLVSILDETGIRIGNQQYVDKNGTYGLTTLRRKHMDIEGDTIHFEYKGKSNKIREVAIEDCDLVKMIKKTAELPGYEIFRYKDSSGVFQSVDSDEVNEYIRRTMGQEFSSKDFRTWVATRMAVELYPEAKILKEQNPRRKFTSILLRLVANELGNTPTVCKSYYVHPTIMQLIEKKELPDYNKYKEDTKQQLSSSELLILDVVQ